MSNKPFIYQAPFPMGKDNTEYYLLTSDYVSVADFDGETILKVEPEALTLLAQQAFHDASFMLRPAHQKQVAKRWCRSSMKKVRPKWCNAPISCRRRARSDRLRQEKGT